MNEDWLSPEQIPTRTWPAAVVQVGGAGREGAQGRIEDQAGFLQGGST